VARGASDVPDPTTPDASPGRELTDPMDPHLLTALVAAIGRVEDPAALDATCSACAVALGVDGVAVTVLGPTPQQTVVAANDEPGKQLKEAELAAGQGPCIDAARTDTTVSTPDLSELADDRWPALARQLGTSPVRAVIAVPLTTNEATLGSLNLYSRQVGGLEHLPPPALELIAHAMTDTVVRLRPSDLLSSLAGQPTSA